VKKGRSGAEEIKQMMTDFRENPPAKIAGSAVTEVRDYLEQTSFDIQNGQKSVMDGIPKSNVLIYYTADGTKVCVRPSGTEPKIKFYVSVKDSIQSEEEFRQKLTVLDGKIQQVKSDLKL
jgi:phosphoglucomutase